MKRGTSEELKVRKYGNANKRGITLIALIITIIVMLILVMVSVQIAMDTGLFESAGKATKNWSEEQEKEGELSSGKVTIGGVTYNSIEEYTNSLGEVDFEKLFETAEKHPDQSETNNDIGIAEDGSAVNLDLWEYKILSNGTSYALASMTSSSNNPGYSNSNINQDTGKIQGKVPMYIKESSSTEYYPVTSMFNTFYNCTNLVIAPEIPSTVTNMNETFYGCISLTTAPEIPSSVTNMKQTFYGCTSLTTAPEIPSSVTNMKQTFYNCRSLSGTLTINATPTEYAECLNGAATGSVASVQVLLLLDGESNNLSEILATKSATSNIELAQ